MTRTKAHTEAEKWELLKKEVEKGKTENTLDDILKYRLPEATRFFEVHDRVRYGAWDWSIVLEILESGKVYKLFSYTWHTKRNVADYAGYKIHYIAWYDVQPYLTDEEAEAIDQFTQRDDIRFNFSQRDVMAILYMCFDQYGIDFDADYQRGNVWTEQQKVDLIDSIFKNIDIGKFVFIRRPWGRDPNKPKTPLLWEVLDGKQRSTALLDFFLNRFKYKGKYFSELHPFDRNHIRHYSISFAETEPLTQEQKYRYFLKLNTTGTPVDPDHIKKVQEMWEKERNDTTNQKT